MKKGPLREEFCESLFLKCSCAVLVRVLCGTCSRLVIFKWVLCGTYPSPVRYLFGSCVSLVWNLKVERSSNTVLNR
ncbi:hypothetical protein DPV73_01180 [Leptospira mayottensis]|nr:hypothetical protein DPV73_01100 [Leptospira mayottensis]AXR66846.1 hypothetical protein DPV73_01180 [Leptospira mayottensis]